MTDDTNRTTLQARVKDGFMETLVRFPTGVSRVVLRRKHKGTSFTMDDAKADPMEVGAILAARSDFGSHYAMICQRPQPKTIQEEESDTPPEPPLTEAEREVAREGAMDVLRSLGLR